MYGVPYWVLGPYLLAGLVVGYSMLGLNRRTRGPNRFYPDGLVFPFVVALWLPMGVALAIGWAVWRIRNKGAPR